MIPPLSRQFISPPTFPGNEEKSLRASLLFALNLIGLAYSAIVFPFQVINGRTPYPALLLNIVEFAIHLLNLYLLRRGRVNLSGILLLVVGYTRVTMTGLALGTIRTPATSMYLVIILMTGLLFEWRGVWISTGASSLAVIGMILAENAGLLPAADFSTTYVQWITYTFIFASFGILSIYYNRIIRSSLVRARNELAERQRVELELRKLTPGVEQSPASILITDLQGSIEYVNLRFTQVSGYSREEVIGKNPRILKSGLTPPEMYKHLWRQISAGKEWRGVLVNRKKEGAVFYEASIITPIMDGNGAVTHYMAVNEDITADLKTQRNMVMQRDLAQTLAGITSIQEALELCLERTLEAAVLDCGGIYLVDRLTGDLEMLVVQGLSPAFYDLTMHVAKGSPRWQIVMAGKAIFTIYDQIRTQNIPVVINEGIRAVGLVPLLHQGQVIGCFNLGSHTRDEISADDQRLIQEITLQVSNALVRIMAQEDLQRSHDELRRSEARFASLFNQVNDAVYLFGLDGQIQAANQRAADLLGYTLSELQSLSKMDISAETEQTQAVLVRLLAGEQFPPFERLYRKKDGELLPVEVNIELVRDGNGRPLHFQSVARDITRRKQAEAALKAARDELEQRVEERTAALHSANRSLEKALRSRDEFMAAVSHELRTPLSGILGFSEALQITLNDGLSARQIKAVQHIEASGRRLLELINVVLDYTLIQSGKLQLSLAPCSLTNICQSSLQAVGAKASAKEQLLELNISHPGARLVADERRLHQVVNSLLDNAVKFTPEGGRIGLQVDYLVDEKLVRLSVTDTGIGIHQDDLPRMFQPFVQLDARLSRRYTGAGLSLALARALVELHSGSLAVESSPGQGSSFIMTLPWQEEIQRQV